MIKAFATHFQTGEEFRQEYRIIRPDKAFCWLWGRSFPIRDQTGQVYRLVGIVEDISERQAALRDRKQIENSITTKV